MAESAQEVYVEHNGKIIKLYLTPAEAIRAAEDDTFASNLVNEEQNKDLHNLNESIDTVASISSPISEESDKFIWPSKDVYLLLQNYEEHKTEFSSGIKRHSKIWENIAKDINKISEIAVTGTQCQSKFNSLKKMYRKVLDHNNISGNDRKSWLYFERMHEIFGKSGWANPKAIASEAGPSFSANKENANKESKNSKDSKEGPAIKKVKTEKVLDEFIVQMKQDRQEREMRKEERRLAVLQELKDQKEKQHQDKMDIMKKFCEAIAGKKIFD